MIQFTGPRTRSWPIAGLGERIAGRIEARGPIPLVSEYVEACLYDADGGFYNEIRRGASRGAVRGIS